jgi:hypothetical protein
VANEYETRTQRDASHLLAHGSDYELAPYFAVDFNDPNDSEVGLRVLMSEDDWKDSLTRLVGK